MKVFYSPYNLSPLRKANRHSNLDLKEGVFLKGTLKNQTTFVDYFPHTPLGDRCCEEFLPEFKFQNFEYDEKVFDLLLKDHHFQKLKAKSFFNHQLWNSSDEIDSPVIKVKLMDPEDLNFLKPLSHGIKVRLDCNGMFTKDKFRDFFKMIPEKLLPLIEYFEDPLSDLDWNLGLPCARDFIPGAPFQYYIYKPNCEFSPVLKDDTKVIYSSYMGSDFGRWQSYCELALTGDLKLVHGIITPSLYSEQRLIFKGDYVKGFGPVTAEVKKLYQDLSTRPWKLLCSI